MVQNPIHPKSFAFDPSLPGPYFQIYLEDILKNVGLWGVFSKFGHKKTAHTHRIGGYYLFLLADKDSNPE